MAALLNFKSLSSYNHAASHPLTSAAPPPLTYPSSVQGVLSPANVGSSGFTQNLMLTFQRTKPSTNTHSRWLVEGGQAQKQVTQWRTLKDRKKQQVQKENNFYYDGVRLVKQITRLGRRKMSPACYQAGSLSKM